MARLFDDWEARGLVFQSTSAAVRAALDGEAPVTAYIGFDPTAASLHVGSLLPVTMLMRLQRAGHRPIALVGGGTGLVGDPSGKSSERPMLDEATLATNLAGLRAQLERLLDFEGDRAAVLVDNHEWLSQLSLIDFMRDVGKHFSVNAMVARDSVKRRLEAREQGISYTEFSYMLFQAYDFLELHDRLGCTLQLGGSDQWGNIVSGTDLIRRARGAEALGLTFPLVTKADGAKFGKSEAGNVWLDPARTTPFEFFQFWLNTADADAGRLLRLFSFRDLADIAALEAALTERPSERAAQRALAVELTERVHGADARRRAERCTRVLFGGGDLRELDAVELREAFAGAPTTALPRAHLSTPDATLASLMIRTGLCPSGRRARQDITSGAVRVNERQVRDASAVLTAADVLAETVIVLKRGKKTYHVLRVEG